MPKREIKAKVAEYINNIPLVIDPCRMCRFMDKDKESHVDNVDVCKNCCWYYDSMFEVDK